MQAVIIIEIMPQRARRPVHPPRHDQQHQIILLHRHPDQWDHLLMEVELPEVAAAVAEDDNQMYFIKD
jgi:hypothetical protein